MYVKNILIVAVMAACLLSPTAIAQEAADMPPPGNVPGELVCNADGYARARNSVIYGRQDGLAAPALQGALNEKIAELITSGDCTFVAAGAFAEAIPVATVESVTVAEALEE